MLKVKEEAEEEEEEKNELIKFCWFLYFFLKVNKNKNPDLESYKY